DLDAPALVLGEMPMEDIELVQREKIDVLEHELLRHEVASNVEVAPAPAEARSILDLDGRDRPGHAVDAPAPKDLGRKQLPQRVRAVEDAGRLGRADRDPFGVYGEAIALVAEIRERPVERERDPRPVRGRCDQQRITA